MTTQFSDLAQRVAADGIVTADEVLALRREGWGDGIITREEAEALFAINNVIGSREEQWCDFFSEAIGEYVLNGTQPTRQCNEAEADWLIAQIDHDGVCESYAELETMVRIIERAENVPDKLKNYVIAQIEKEVLEGTGPTRCGGELSSTHITSAEVKVLRRVVFASGGYGPAAVSRFEAEMLFRIKDATLADDNAPEWDDLFLDGVSNHLRGFAVQNAQIEHKRRRELEAFVADTSTDKVGFFISMFKQRPDSEAGMDAVKGVASAVATGKTRGGAVSELGGERLVAQAKEGAAFTDFEQDWLMNKMITADGQTDDLERRLIKRVLEEGE